MAKTSDPLPDVAPGLVGDYHNMAFKGTLATYGRATGVVVAAGMVTELGRIAQLLDSVDRVSTPLQHRLAVLGRWMAAAALAVCVLVFAVGVSSGEPARQMFLTAVSLAVAAIPEGLGCRRISILDPDALAGATTATAPQ